MIKPILRLAIWSGILVLILGVALGAATVPPADAPEGDWQGTLDTGAGTLSLVLHVKKAADTTLNGTLDSPDQGAKDIKLTTVTYKAPLFHFEIKTLMATYDGKINKKNTEIAGNWAQQGASLPLTFKRVTK